MYFAYDENQVIRVDVITLSTVNSGQLASGILTVSVRVSRAPFSLVSVLEIPFFLFSFVRSFFYDSVCV